MGKAFAIKERERERERERELAFCKFTQSELTELVQVIK